MISYETLEFSTSFECKPVDSAPPPPECNHGYGWSFFGPCNGIIGLWMLKEEDYPMGTSVLLWNPSTRQLFQTAKSNYEIMWKMGFMGLGFDADAKDYKIVFFNCSEIYAPHGILIYSLASDSWRMIEDSNVIVWRGKELLNELSSSNGRMCSWIGIMSEIGYQYTYFVLSFDMVDEVFVETPIPDGAQESINRCCFVQQRSHLSHPAIVCYGNENWNKVRFVNVWVLQDYGKAGHWSKQVSVMLPEDIIVSQPTGFWKDDEILFMGYGDVAAYARYNCRTRELKTLNHIHVEDYSQYVIGYTLTESLVSIQTNYRQRDKESSDNNDLDYCFCEVGQPL